MGMQLLFYLCFGVVALLEPGDSFSEGDGDVTFLSLRFNISQVF